LAGPTGRFLGTGGVPSSPRVRSGVLSAARPTRNMRALVEKLSAAGSDSEAMHAALVQNNAALVQQAPKVSMRPEDMGESALFARPDEFSYVGNVTDATGNDVGPTFAKQITPMGFLRERLLGDLAEGVEQRLVERNQPGQNGLLPQVGRDGMKAQINRPVNWFMGPRVSDPDGEAWYEPGSASIFVNSGRGRAIPHEVIHSALDAWMPQGRPDDSFSWKTPRRTSARSFADDLDMPVETRGGRETPEQQMMRLNGISPYEAGDWADAFDDAIYNRHPPEMRARLMELKLLQGLREGRMPETPLENRRLLQRLLDEPSFQADPLIERGPLKGQQYPGFRDQQRALQLNWQTLTPEGKEQIRDLFFRLGDTNKPEPGRA